jgi:hypothetical protein
MLTSAFALGIDFSKKLTFVLPENFGIESISFLLLFLKLINK